MAIPCFYCPDLNVNMIINDDSIISLSEIESSHAVRSRRLREGDEVHLLNGLGVVAKGNISHVDKRNVRIKLGAFQQLTAKPPKLAVATAIPKGDRQKVMIDMLTQLGLSEIYPLACEHSVTRYSDNLGEKWKRSAIEACKQSQNAWLPTVHTGRTIEQLCQHDDYHIVYTDAAGVSMSEVRQQANEIDKTLMVIIGPEGGFSRSEIKYFAERNIGSLSLGDYILRTEAAAVASMAQFLS